jgi:hypothetical protein
VCALLLLLLRWFAESYGEGSQRLTALLAHGQRLFERDRTDHV